MMENLVLLVSLAHQDLKEKPVHQEERDSLGYLVFQALTV